MVIHLLLSNQNTVINSFSLLTVEKEHVNIPQSFPLEASFEEIETKAVPPLEKSAAHATTKQS